MPVLALIRLPRALPARALLAYMGAFSALGVLACSSGTTPAPTTVEPHRGPVAVPRPSGAASPPSSADAASSASVLAPRCFLQVRELAARTSAAWGDVRPSVSLTAEEGDALRVWFPARYQGPFHGARLESDGTLKGETEQVPFARLGEASYPVVVRTDAGVAAVASVYVASENADLYVATNKGKGWSTPVAVLPGPELDTAPAPDDGLATPAT